MSTSTTPIRFHFLDALRGFAIAGILLVNTADIMHLGRHGPVLVHPVIPPAANALYFLVATRFVPIFSFMFGMSMGFVIDSAVRRGEAGWKILLRRLGALVIIGLLNSILYPGEILLAYAIMGILALPVVLAVPRSWRLGLGLAATIGAYAVAGGGNLSLPGLLLLGSAAQAYGLPALLERADRRVGAAALLFAAATAAAIPWQAGEPGDPRFFVAGGVAGGVMACLYVCLLALLWRTPVRRVLRAAFEPLGRMALTCYVTATFVMVPAGMMLHAESRSIFDVVPGLVVAVAVLAVQWIACRLWLSRFSYGPLEWAWRCATWWRVVPLRASRPVATSASRDSVIPPRFGQPVTAQPTSHDSTVPLRPGRPVTAG